MKLGIMFGYELFLWIIILAVSNARHVPLSSQRSSAQSRPRLLVIRPPEGSGQPNRIVVLANQRPRPTNPSPPLSTAITALQETAAVAQANLNRAFGGHPQSAFRHQASSSSSSSSGSSGSSSASSASSGTRSIRNLIQGLRRSGPSTSSNIARVSDTIPRAMPPVLPPATRFGELNIPSVIEAALRRLQDRARVQGNVRDTNVLPRHDFRMSHSGPPKGQNDRSPFSGGVIDLSRVSLNDRNNRNDVTSVDTSRTNSNPRWDVGTIQSTSTLGRNGVSPLANVWDQSPVGTTVNEVGSGFNANDILQMPTDTRSFPSSSVGRTGSNLRTFQDKTFDRTATIPSDKSTVPSLDIQTLLSDPWTPTEPFMPTQRSHGMGMGSAFDVSSQRKIANFSDANQPQSSRTNFDASIPAPSRIGQIISPSGPSTVKQVKSSKNVNDAPVPVAAVNLNSSAKVSASSSESNSTSNTTSTKSVKTKTIKVTTVVKGGTKADVAAAAASQAEIANAVAQGKEINSSALTGLAKAASGVKSPKINSGNNPPAGSITVKRQTNGDSIITLADGQGEPVVLRASGPVKIERIIKPNGRIQFLINPVKPPVDTTPTPAADAEIEPEDITTAISSPMAAGSGIIGFTNDPWTTTSPFYTDPSYVKLPDVALGSGAAKIEKTVQITDTAISNTASASVDTSVKNDTVNAQAQNQNLIQLFKAPRIPPPPKVSDMNLGNAGLSNPFINNIIRTQTKNVPPPSDVSMFRNVYTSTTVATSVSDKSKGPLNLFPNAVDKKHVQNQQKQTTHATETMPQYNLLGVSPSLTFVPKGNQSP